jgi:hypothetical protein
MFSLKWDRDSQSRFYVSSVSSEFQQCHWHCWNRFSGVIDTAETDSAVSMTPLKPFQRWHWHCWNFIPDPHTCFRGVIETTEIISAGSMIPRKFGKKNFCGWNPYDIFHFTIMVVSAVSLIPLKWFQRCQWHRWNSNNVDYFSEYKAICKTVLACESGP